MNKNIKISGLCIAIAIVGLSLGNALTGHGIKGNKNLNPVVMATGSNSSSNSNSNSGMGNCTSSWPGDCIQTGNNIYGPQRNIGNLHCNNLTGNEGGCWDCVRDITITCNAGSIENCTSGSDSEPEIYCPPPY